MNRILLGIFALMLASCQSPQEVLTDQYIAEGYGLYQTHCANCHQKNGEGLSELYPPIKAEFLKDQKRLAKIVREGIKEPLTVNGKAYARPMPANNSLHDLDVAEIITYLNSQYKLKPVLLPVDSVYIWFN